MLMRAAEVVLRIVFVVNDMALFLCDDRERAAGFVLSHALITLAAATATDADAGG
jgi:hypothetical protein